MHYSEKWTAVAIERSVKRDMIDVIKNNKVPYKSMSEYFTALCEKELKKFHKEIKK